MTSRLDEFVPAFQFVERHAITIPASPARIYEAVSSVTAREIRLFRTLTWLRRFGRSGPESILNAPPDVPIVDVAVRTMFILLADDRPLSTETRIWATDESARRRFGMYWRVIYPGSALIRRMWLRAIRKRAMGFTPV
ncbi:MAG: hypothetical protein LC804_24755 [Acidobacteria bacterium]|nr:hypothetical protein [Acidobacteriota bacterium]